MTDAIALISCFVFCLAYQLLKIAIKQHPLYRTYRARRQAGYTVRNAWREALRIKRGIY